MAKQRGGALSAVSFRDLRKEMARRQRRVGGLMRRRDRFMTKVRALDAQISELGGAVGGAGMISVRKRPKNEMNLVQSLSQVLKDKTMSVTEVAEAVQKFGYQTTSPSFRTIVNQTLINSGKFKRISRGKYTAK